MKRRRVFIFVFLVLLGFLPLLNSIGNPHLAGIRAVDRLQLIASGICFGAGIGILLGGRKFPGE